MFGELLGEATVSQAESWRPSIVAECKATTLSCYRRRVSVIAPKTSPQAQSGTVLSSQSLLDVMPVTVLPSDMDERTSAQECYPSSASLVARASR
jgi:hypothetical protein